MTDIPIEYTETDTKGRYAIRLPGIEEEAELTLSKVSARLIIADHTYVPDAMRGQGIAGALIQRLIADARAKDQQIIPLCPVVRAYAERHRDELAGIFKF